ncbi:hypothetical protein D3C81_649490 [compost metagenome]
MGEEKPDEELMGKRKLASRLSTALLNADNVRMALCFRFYTSLRNLFSFMARMWYYRREMLS